MTRLGAEHVSKQYRGGALANDDVSLGVEAGEVFGLLGPNGAGKTTLVGQILGLLRPTSGRIFIDGADVTDDAAHARRACTYQPQGGVPIVGMSPLEAIDIAGRVRGAPKAVVRTRARELVEALDLDQWSKKLSGLSGGVARLVSFCMAAVVPGRVVILDEPTNDVDPLRRKLLWQRVRALAEDGAAVLLVTHNVLEAERCVDRLAIMDAGRVVAHGTPGELKSRLGAQLRLELHLDPGSDVPKLPRYLHRPVQTGRRLMVDVSERSVGAAVTWARKLRESGIVDEFAVGPATLEDVYAHVVGRTMGAA